MKNSKRYRAFALLILFVCTFSLQNASAISRKFTITPNALFAQKFGKLVTSNDMGSGSCEENLYETEDEDNLNSDIALLNFYQTAFDFVFHSKTSASILLSENINKPDATDLYLHIHAIRV